MPTPHDTSRDARTERLVRALGWFSVGLGTTQVLAPQMIGRLIGVRGHTGLMRTFGLREIASGVGLLTQRSSPAWVWARVAGDALDLIALGIGLTNPHARGRTALATAAVAGVAALDVFAARALQPEAGDGTSTPLGASSGASEVERAVTIGRSAEELYQRWRDPQTMAQVMGHVADVRATADGSLRWTVHAPLGKTFTWTSELVDEQPGERLRWASTEGAAFRNELTVRFRPAPQDWGTEVHLRVRFDPPAGALGDAAFKLLGIAPDLLTLKALKRFKSLAEVGEMPTLARNPSGRGQGDLV